MNAFQFMWRLPVNQDKQHTCVELFENDAFAGAFAEGLRRGGARKVMFWRTKLNAQTYRKTINAAIKHLGVYIVAGRGYSYFMSLKTRDQIGESVMVYRQSDASVAWWLAAAISACEEHRHTGFNLEALPAISS